MRGGDAPAFEDFCNKIESLFEDEARVGVVTLSTVHRAKGDEADRVFIVGSQLLPFTFKSSQAWQIKQEMNIVYVALTRAKQDLFLVLFPRSKKDEDKLEDWLDDALGGLRLPRQTAQKSNPIVRVACGGNPMDIEWGAKFLARGLDWVCSGVEWTEEAEAILHLPAAGDPLHKERWSWEECRTGISGIIQTVTDPPATMDSDSLTSEVQFYWRRRQIGRLRN